MTKQVCRYNHSTPHRLGAIAMALALSSSAFAAEYTLVDLGVFPGESQNKLSFAYGINNASQVVGWGSKISVAREGFIWDGGVWTSLGDLPGGVKSSEAHGINNLGVVVGFSSGDSATTPGTTQQRGFIWQGGTMSALPDIAGYQVTETYALSVNDSGKVVGYSGVVGGYRAVLWSGGVAQDLGVIGPSYASSKAFAINNQGQVVGESTGSNIAHAFIWQNGVMTSLGDLPGGGDNYSSAAGINNLGQVVGTGYVDKGSASTDRAHAFLWENGTMLDLGVLGDVATDLSYATDINNLGQVVGYGTTASGSSASRHAFIWQNGVMRDLNELIELPLGSEIELKEAMAINDKGEVVGWMYDEVGYRHAFLAIPTTPVPEPGTYALLLAGLGFVGWAVRRKQYS